MTLPGSPAATAVARGESRLPISAAQASWLLISLRFGRWQNQARDILGGGTDRSAARAARRSAGAESLRADLGVLVFFALLLALFCLQSFNQFEDIAREQGAAAVSSRAAVLSSVLISAALLTALGGARAQSNGADADLEWLSTLPVPSWILYTAKVVEAALMNPIGWMLIFPFFTGLGLHKGVGVAAPLVAVALCAPLFTLHALLQWLADVAGRRLSSAPVLRLARAAATALGVLVFATWLGAPALARLNVTPLGGWLGSSRELTWLPFAEPALILTSLPHTPGRALAWLGLFAVEASAAIVASAFVLRRLHSNALHEGGRARRGERGAGTPQQRVVRGRLLDPIIGKDLLWLWRNPARMAGLVLNGLLANVVAVFWLARTGDAPAPNQLAAAAFGVGLWQLFLLFVLLEAERPAFAHLATLPRSMARVFAVKSLFAAAGATAAALPVVLYVGSELPHFVEALPVLLYSLAGVLLFAFVQTALWVRRVEPNTAPRPLHHAFRSMQLLLLAGFFAGGLASPSLGRSLPVLVFAASFAFAFWYDALERAPFALDPTTRRPATLSATFAIMIIVAMRVVQVEVVAVATKSGLRAPLALTASYILAGALVCAASLLWLRSRGVTALPEHLGLRTTAPLTTALREGLLWSALAVAVNATFLGLSQTLFAQPSLDGAGSMLASSPLAFAGLTLVAAPLVEELLFRGMLYRALRARWGVGVSVLLSAAVFTAGHPFAAAVPLFGMAVCAALAVERARSLLAAILVHVAYNGFVVWQVLSVR